MFRKLKSQIRKDDEKQSEISGNNSLISNTSYDYESAASNSTLSRVNSFSSFTSEAGGVAKSNSTPQRKLCPPSDIESDYETSLLASLGGNANESFNNSSFDLKKFQKLLDVYKTKYNKLKIDYDESENEKEKIKKILANSQDNFLKKIQSLKDENRNTIVEKDKIIEELKCQQSNKSKSYSGETNSNEQIAEIKKQHQTEMENLEKHLINKKNEEVKQLEDKLSHAEIDLNSLNEKLNQNLEDYRISIEKLKQTNNQRIKKVKKALSNCVLVLNLIDESLFKTNDENNKSNFNFLTLFINSLKENTSRKKSEHGLDLTYDNLNESTLDEGLSLTYEFQESKIRELIRIKTMEFEKLNKLGELENQIENLNTTVGILNKELEQAKNELLDAKTKLIEQKKEMDDYYKLRIEELELKLLNLNKLNEQNILNNNQETELLKSKITTLENELISVQNQNQELLAIQKEFHEKNLTSQDKNDKIDTLKSENFQLIKQLEELKTAFDELKDEKAQLYLAFNEMKTKFDIKQNLTNNDSMNKSYSESTRSFMSDLTNKQNHKSKDSCESSNSKFLESIEISYLKKIIYAYMTGVDKLTMAKVIGSVLKFSDDEQRKIIENEKRKK